MADQELPRGTIVSVGMNVVLNGGKAEMNSATVPIQWFFDEKTVKQSPKHLLFFEQDDEEAKSYQSDNLGRRYVCEMKRGVKFLQIFKPGKHRVIIMAFSEGNKKKVQDFLMRTGESNYSYSIVWDHIQDRKISDECLSSYECLAYCVVEFYVPGKLFADKPKTALQKAVWWWCNLWFTKNPADQCAYRKRKMFAPVQLLLVAILGPLYAVLISFMSIIVLFIGWRPLPIFREIGKAFLLVRHPFDEYRRYPFESFYRVWYEPARGNKKLMPATGLEIFIGACLVYIFGYLIHVTFNAGLFIGLMAIVLWCFVLLLLFVLIRVLSDRLAKFLSRYGFFQKYTARRKVKEDAAKKRVEELLAQKKAEMEAEYQAWLLANYGLDHMPAEVRLGNVPRPLGIGARTAQVFYVGFWGLKAKVCKPFSK